MKEKMTSRKPAVTDCFHDRTRALSPADAKRPYNPHLPSAPRSHRLNSYERALRRILLIAKITRVFQTKALGISGDDVDHAVCEIGSN